ncbi:MAG: PepSY domain-containing protein [Maritimibacter sp.]|nr:PepSY domain-containing protein [Maritimibacter sp.]
MLRTFSVERVLKTVHGWLGIFVLPFLVAIGLTGLALNHWGLVDAMLSPPDYDEARFDAWPDPVAQGLPDALALARTLWPDAAMTDAKPTTYHDRDAWELSGGGHDLIVDAATGHYWVKTRLRRETYAPDGTLLHSRFYWGTLFKTIHERGWVDARFGTWLADITAGAMVLFGVSGLYLFLAPRLRRRRNRKARTRAMAQG